MPEMLPIWRHLDDVLITNLAVRVPISTRISSKGGEDERWGSKNKKYEVAEVTKMICIVWQVVSKIDRKSLCSWHQPNGGLKVTHGCSTPTLQLSSLVLCLRLREAPLLALRRMIRLYLISGGGPGDMRGGINSTNIFRIVWEKVPNPDIDSDGSEDTKSHSSFSGLSGHLLRLIQQIRVIESYFGTLRHKVTFRVVST